MEWWEKESAYEDQFRSGRQAKNLWKYIPQKLCEAVSEAYSDSDGYWIHLNEGWIAYDGGNDCGIIHCYTINDLKADIKTIRKADR